VIQKIYMKITKNELIHLVNGKILYHGTNIPDLKKLVPPNNNYVKGMYLTSSKRVALSFGSIVYSIRVSNIKNPYIIDAKDEGYNSIKTPREFKKSGFTYLDEVDTGLVADFAFENKYDCAIILNIYEGFSVGGIGLSYEKGNNFILFNENQMEIVSKQKYKHIPYTGKIIKVPL